MSGISPGAGITFGSGITISNTNDVPVIFSADGSSYNGWNLADTYATTTITQVQGNPAPSWQVTTRGFYRKLGINYLNKTIAFNVRPGTNCDVGIAWAQNQGGNSANKGVLRIRQSATDTQQGLTTNANGGWLYIGANGNETTAIFPTANIWYNVKVRIGSDRVVTWYVNDTLQASSITHPVGYTTSDVTNTWFGFITNTSTAQFDNLNIYDGIV